MSNKNKKNKPSNGTAESTSVKEKYSSNKNSGSTFLFGKTNYQWMIGGILLIFVGFLCMMGGKSSDPNVFNYDEIYSFRRVTLAPILVMLGFLVEIYAIMHRPK